MSENLASFGAPPTPPEEQKPIPLPAESDTGQQMTPPVNETSTAQTEQLAEEKASDTGAHKIGMDDVFSEEYTYPSPKRGEIRLCRIISMREEGIMVDLGLKREGLVPSHDLQRVGSEAVNALQVGDEIPVYIIRPEHNQEGNLIVSWHRARQEQDWLDAEKLHETGEVWEGPVRGYNRGGLIVPYGKIRGFVPASHITGISRRMDQTTLQTRLSEMVGKTLPLKVLEVNRENRRLIFSERIARREWRAQQREKLLDTLQEGDHVHGVVSNVCDFGVFVDVGGTDGLVHISELSWHRTNHPSEIVQVGDEVEAYVLRVDKERRRIGLSLKLVQPDPWETAQQDYAVGQLVTGVITKLTDFGAFAALGDGIEGLVHISELADISPKHPKEVVSKDDVVPLVIVKIDAERRRMGLSLRRVSEEQWYGWEEERKAQVQAESPAAGVEAKAPATSEEAGAPAASEEVEAPAASEEADAAEELEFLPQDEPEDSAHESHTVETAPAEFMTEELDTESSAEEE